MSDERLRQDLDRTVVACGSGAGTGVDVRTPDDGHRNERTSIRRQQRRLAIDDHIEVRVEAQDLDFDRSRLQAIDGDAAHHAWIDASASFEHVIAENPHGHRRNARR